MCARYVARLCVMTVNDEYGGRLGLLRYIVTPFALIDLLAVLPFWLDVITPGDAIPPTQSVSHPNLLRSPALPLRNHA